MPPELLDAAGVEGEVAVRHVFDERGAIDEAVSEATRDGLMDAGFVAVMEDQASAVFIIE